MTFFTNLGISRKIMAAFALALLVVGVSGLITHRSLGALTASVEANKASIRAKELNGLMLDSVIQQENALRGYAMFGRDELLNEYRQSQASYQQQSKEFGDTAKDPAQLSRLTELNAEVKDLNDNRFAKLVAFAARPETRSQAQQIAGKKQLTKVRELIGEINQRQSEIIADRRAGQETASSAANTAVWLGAGLTALVSLLMGWVLTRTIAAPLASMTGVMTRLAQGENNVDVPAVDRGDEIGAMAKTVLVFKDNAIAKAAGDAEKAAAEAQLAAVVTTMDFNLGELRDRNLTSRVTVDFPPAYATLKTSFNDAIDQVRTALEQVTESASAIRTGSHEIAQASEDLARRTESNAASLEETSAALTQIDGRLRATASSSAQTVHRAGQAMATVGGGRATAVEAVAAMGRVSDSAKGIDSVIEGLDKIAFQTRVLAMNAAVEAGRAGDAGRGFAVVADLVSALAMRAEEEAKRARDQLSVTQTEIGTAVQAVHKVDEALMNISGDVEEVNTLLGTMADDATAQSSAITQITAAIGAMDQSTQQNAAMVEETSAAARNLMTEVGSLSDQAAMFKTGEAVRAPVVAPKPMRQSPMPPARSQVARSKTTPASAPYRSPVKALPPETKTVMASDEDWNSF